MDLVSRSDAFSWPRSFVHNGWHADARVSQAGGRRKREAIDRVAVHVRDRPEVAFDDKDFVSQVLSLGHCYHQLCHHLFFLISCHIRVDKDDDALSCASC